MAAASAGAIQTGFLSEEIAPSSSQLQQHHHSGKFNHLTDQSEFHSHIVRFLGFYLFRFLLQIFAYFNHTPRKTTPA